MQQQKGFTLLEIIAVVIIIAILALVFFRYAEGIVEEAEQTSLEAISRSFANTVGNLRGKWFIENSKAAVDNRSPMVTLDSQPLYVNEFGWPANTSADSDPGSDTQTAQECRQIWEAITQNPTATTVDSRRRGEQRLHISAPRNHVCRYELTSATPATHYFDYDLKTGRIDLHTPPHKRSD